MGLSGALEQVFGYSFILTDLDGDTVEIEQWQRQRAHVEERISVGGHEILPIGGQETPQ